MAPKRDLERLPKWPNCDRGRIFERCPKSLKKTTWALQESPWEPQERPKRPQESPRGSKRSPKGAQKGAKTMPKGYPRGSQIGVFYSKFNFLDFDAGLERNLS